LGDWAELHLIDVVSLGLYACTWMSEPTGNPDLHATGVRLGRAKERSIVAMLAVGWCLVLLLRFAFTYELLWMAFGLTSLALDGALLVSGVVLVAVLVAQLREASRVRTAACLITMLALGGVGYGTYALEDMGRWFRFLRLRSTYVNILADVESGLIDKDGWRGNVLVRLEPSDGELVAFVWGGIVDNWIGVVHDPTGGVMQANAFLPDWSNWDAPELAKVRGLFGGDLYYAEHLQGDWYLCWFT